MARRLAEKHGLAPESDADAISKLRAKGIDPFDRSSLLALVVPEDKAATLAQRPAEAQIRAPAPAAQAKSRTQSEPRPRSQPREQAAPAGKTQLPLKIEPAKTPAPVTAPKPPAHPAPATAPGVASGGAREILEMQRDIARRRLAIPAHSGLIDFPHRGHHAYHQLTGRHFKAEDQNRPILS